MSKRIPIGTSSTDVGWQRETLLGVREYVEGKHWTLLVQLRGRNPLSQAFCQNIDGSILDLTDAVFYRSFSDIPGPKVSYSDSMDASLLPRATMDNAQAGGLSAQHFWERNITNLAFFGADRGVSSRRTN